MAFHDFDADGDIDALLGGADGRLTFERNVGNAEGPPSHMSKPNLDAHTNAVTDSSPNPNTDAGVRHHTACRDTAPAREELRGGFEALLP